MLTANAAENPVAPPEESEHERKTRERLERVNRLLETCSGWYVVLVPPQKEVLYERALQLVGYEPFVPIEFRWRRVNSRQKVKRHVPYVMASRYVFLGVDKAQFAWGRLMSMGLPIRPLMHDGKPVWIDPFTMIGLFSRSKEAQDRLSSVRLNKSIVVGDAVMITDGPFKGHMIRVDGIDKGRAKATVQLFQTAQEIEISLNDLEGV